MLSDTVSKWKRVAAGLAAASAVAVVGSTNADTTVPIDDDERPPIIVNNGSIEFEGDDGFLGLHDGGTWDGTGSVFRHVHGKPGPRFLQLKTSPNNQYCRVGTSTTLEKSPFVGSTVAITFGTSAQTWTVTASIVTVSSMNYLQLDFGNKPPTRTQDRKRLTIADSERIYSLVIDERAASPVRCEFPAAGSKVDLKIYQKR